GQGTPIGFMLVSRRLPPPPAPRQRTRASSPLGAPAARFGVRAGRVRPPVRARLEWWPARLRGRARWVRGPYEGPFSNALPSRIAHGSGPFWGPAGWATVRSPAGAGLRLARGSSSRGSRRTLHAPAGGTVLPGSWSTSSA